MAEDGHKDVDDLTVTDSPRDDTRELRARGRRSQLDPTSDGEARRGRAPRRREAGERAPRALDRSEHRDRQGPPEERLAKHEQSSVDAMGLDKRRGVVGQKYGASFAKQATVYGVFLVVLVALVIGGKLAVDELDKGPKVTEDRRRGHRRTPSRRPGRPDFPPSVTP